MRMKLRRDDMCVRRLELSRDRFGPAFADTELARTPFGPNRAPAPIDAAIQASFGGQTGLNRGLSRRGMTRIGEKVHAQFLLGLKCMNRPSKRNIFRHQSAHRTSMHKYLSLLNNLPWTAILF